MGTIKKDVQKWLEKEMEIVIILVSILILLILFGMLLLTLAAIFTLMMFGVVLFLKEQTLVSFLVMVIGFIVVAFTMRMLKKFAHAVVAGLTEEF